jgi:hypothetical protein
MFDSKSLRNAVVVAIVVMLAVGNAWAAESAGPRAADGMLGAIPAKSLFCIRINNFDGTLDAANEFLKDLAPPSFDAKKAVFSKLGSVLGDNDLKGINKKGNIAIFGVEVPTEPAAARKMGNMFIGALLPVTNYEDFISANPNCSKPDEQGISTITVNGQPRGLATNFRRFALLCPPNARDNLIKVKEMLGQRRESLRRSLSTYERRQAANLPVWIYLNVKQGATLINPIVAGKLEQMKAELQKLKESGGNPAMVEPSGIVDFYSGIIKVFTEGTDYFTVGLTPSSEACHVSYTLKPVADTKMAEIVGRQMGGNLNHMLGYLQDGAMMNLACKVDRTSLKAGYMTLFDLMGKMFPGSMSEADIEQMKEVTAKAIDALGDSLAISAQVGGEGPVPFRGKYILEVRDRQALEQVIAQELQMMQKGAFADMYKGFGVQMEVNVEQDAGTYEGIAIHAAGVKFKAGENESLQGNAMVKMFGGGLEYRWAFVDGCCVYTVGGEPDKMIRELIDQVRAGGPKTIAPEVKAGLDAIEGSRQADVFGTFNYVRMLNMASGFMFPAASDEAVKIEVPTKSDITFAGRTVDGEGRLRVVLPKTHLLEIKSAFEKLAPQIKKQQELLKQKQQSSQQ